MLQGRDAYAQNLTFLVDGQKKPYEFKFHSEFQGMTLLHFLSQNTCFNGKIRTKPITPSDEVETPAVKRVKLFKRKVMLQYSNGLPVLEIYASMNDDLDMLTTVLHSTARHSPKITQAKYENGKWVPREHAKPYRASVVDMFKKNENGVSGADSLVKFYKEYEFYIDKILELPKAEVLARLGLA